MSGLECKDFCNTYHGAKIENLIRKLESYRLAELFIKKKLLILILNTNNDFRFIIP